MVQQLSDLQNNITSIRNKLVHHTLYQNIKTQKDLATFMEHHVYAVWDFMSLLKALQKSLTCTEIPWIPVGTAETRYLINEIVLGEESDIDESGNRTSHFELYLQAMEQVGCNLEPINALIKNLSRGNSLKDSLQLSNVPKPCIDFIESTFSVINSNDPALQAAVFTFGREDLIPDMFLRFVTELNNQKGSKVSILKYYLERHIEVDGEHHSHLAYKMTEELCGNSNEKWNAATIGVLSALNVRIKLWDAIENQITRN